MWPRLESTEPWGSDYWKLMMHGRFIGSKVAGARYYGKAVRNHWGIENGLHWQLDVTFGEDSNREQGRNAAANLGLVRKLALTLLKQHPVKESMACKRLHAALDVSFLQAVLQRSDNY